MNCKNYIPIGLLATINKEAYIKAYRIGVYYAIFYEYPVRTHIMQFSNMIDACEDFVKRLKILHNNNTIELTKMGENFIKNPYSILRN